MQFIAEATQHIPPKGCEYIRRYGLYASSTKGKWPDTPYLLRFAPEDWKKEHLQTSLQPYDEEEAYSVSDKESQSTRARLIARVYGVDPLVFLRCSAWMRVLSVTGPKEVWKILRHLVKNGWLSSDPILPTI